MSDYEIVDLFAGPGGWDEGLAKIGRRDVLGIENEPYACATAEAAGHDRFSGDIAALNPRDVVRRHLEGLIASPPCPGFSAAGKGLGRQDFELLLGAIHMIGSGFDVATVLDGVRARQNDPRSALTLEPLRWVLELEPRKIALEQVPTVLPLWLAYVPVLESRGYKVWAGNVQAEQYGVPQTRKRALLLASFEGEVGRPTPTHSLYHPRSPERLDDGVAKWVSMAEALRGANDGWVLRNNSSANAAERRPAQPAPTLYFGQRSNYCAWEWRGMGNAPELPAWAFNRPSTTIVGSFKPEIVAAPGYRTTISRQNAPGSVRVTVQEAGVLQSFRPDYPWQGKQGKQFQQVGNAVPPLLAAHSLASLNIGELIRKAAA